MIYCDETVYELYVLKKLNNKETSFKEEDAEDYKNFCVQDLKDLYDKECLKRKGFNNIKTFKQFFVLFLFYEYLRYYNMDGEWTRTTQINNILYLFFKIDTRFCYGFTKFFERVEEYFEKKGITREMVEKLF